MERTDEARKHRSRDVSRVTKEHEWGRVDPWARRLDNRESEAPQKFPLSLLSLPAPKQWNFLPLSNHIFKHKRYKMPKAPGGHARQMRGHNPLSEDYAPSNPHKQKAPKRKGRSNAGDDDNEQQAYIDSKASRKIIALGQDLTAEEDAELEAQRPKNGSKSAFEFERSLRDEEDSDEEAAIPEDDEAWGDEEDEEVEEVEVDPEDLAMFNKFNPEFDPATLLAPQSAEEGESTNLADLILEKIAQHEASQAQGHVIRGGGAPEDAIELPAKVVEVYTQYVWPNASQLQGLG